MVAIKRYGPRLGAGTTITEKLAEATIIPSPLGVVAWAGIFEKGVTNELIEVTGKSSLLRKTGNRILDSYLPICAQDFWDSSKGAGRQFLLRITDGTDAEAEMTFKTREYLTGGFGRWRDALKLTAKSGGRWAGAYKRLIGEITGVGDLTADTMTTGETMLEDEYKNATLQLAGIAGETFVVVGNTVAGVVTVKSDSDLAVKFGAAVDNEYTLFKNNRDDLDLQDRRMEILLKDGANDPDNEFGLEGYWNGAKVIEYPNLSLDPDSANFAEAVINEDTGNEEIVADVLFTGTFAPLTRPANQAGVIPSGGLASTVLTLEWYQSYADGANTGVGTFSAVTARTGTQRDVVTLECNDISTPGSEEWTVTSANQIRTFDDAVTAVAYVGPNDYFLNFTIGVGAPAWAVGDKLYIIVEPIVAAEAIGGRLFYNTEDSKRDSLEIVDATPSTVTVRVGNDLTVTLTAEGKPYRLQFRESLWAGYDGHSGIVDNDYIAAFDTDTSLFNEMKNQQLGLIKFALPGVGSTTVQKSLRSFAANFNSPIREEMPSSIVTETAAVGWVEDTMGLNDFAQVIYPAWYSIADPDKASGLKEIPVVGAVQGVEALFAYSWDGYHKAAAGTKAVLEKCQKIPTGKKVIDDELTNPKGIQVILKKSGNWVIWGDRVPATALGLKFKHKREQLSHYERVLFENSDWIIFAINDPDTQDVALAALRAYFLPEWRPKRALRGKTFEEAASIRADNEINTDATRATGDLNAEVKLRLADTTERFNIVVSPMGVFESIDQG